MNPSAIDDIKRAALTACASPDRRLVHEWAADNLKLPPSITRPGRFDIGTSRHFIAPLESLTDDHVRETNILAPPRSGKSLMADLAVPYWIANDPGPVLWVFQDESMAKSYAKSRALPVLKSAATIRDILPDDRHRETTLEIIFATGLPLTLTGPALNRLQSRGYRYVIIDEPWLLAANHPGRLGEAKARLGDFVKMHTSKLLCMSQGGTAGDDWARQVDTGNRHEWNVACAGCGQAFAPLWTGKRSDGSDFGMRYDSRRREDGRRDLAHAIATLRYECPACGHPHLDTAATKDGWNRTGFYACDSTGNPRRKTYHWNNLIDYPWAELVEQWVSAQNLYDDGYHAPLVQFYQKQLAQHYDATASASVYTLPVIELESPAPPAAPTPAAPTPDTATPAPPKLWEKQEAVFLTVDVQRDHLWALVCAWSKTGEIMVLHFGKHFAWSGITDLQAEFGVLDQCVAVDCGFAERQQEVFAQCVLHGHVNAGRWRCWIALRGDDKPSFTDATRRDRVTGRHPLLPYSMPPQPGDPCLGLHRDDPLRAQLRGRTCPVVTWSNPTIKGIAQVRRDEIQHQTRTFVRKGEWNDEFFAQIHSEALRQTGKEGQRLKWRWVRLGARPNHGWDCFCENIVLAMMRGLLGDVSLRP